jgi:5-methylcytosine-specific restriction protein B
MTLELLRDIVLHHGQKDPWPEVNRESFDAMFGSGGGRYWEESKKLVKLRANKIADEDESVPFAALIEPGGADSGQYGGMSIAIFPVPGAPCLVTFVTGTLGLRPDDLILGRPGHARKIGAWLNRKHGEGRRIAWAKQTPTTSDTVPSEVTKDFAVYGKVFRKYGEQLYGVFASEDKAAVSDALAAFVDLLIEERGGSYLAGVAPAPESIRAEWMEHLLPDVSAEEVHELLQERRFVVIQGPPGTGKSRMAEELRDNQYQGNGKTIQFHPNTTYENFIGGLAPVTASEEGGLGFQFAPLAGELMEAAIAAAADPSRRYLLHVDEINRADLSKVLGEAIYLLEVKPDRKREVRLPYGFPETGRTFTVPDNLDILGTMNTADRSLAILDIAIRRRFAFVDLWPQSKVVTANGGEVMRNAFERLSLIFTEYAPDRSFNYMPGHAYFLEKDDRMAARLLKVTLAPLLREYIDQGYVSGFSESIRSYLQWLEAL